MSVTIFHKMAVPSSWAPSHRGRFQDELCPIQNEAMSDLYNMATMRIVGGGSIGF
jgi:hypothetical protein